MNTEWPDLTKRKPTNPTPNPHPNDVTREQLHYLTQRAIISGTAIKWPTSHQEAATRINKSKAASAAARRRRKRTHT